MLLRILLGMGIILLVFSLNICKIIITKTNDKKSNNSWKILFVLIMFFLTGYIIYFFLHPGNSLESTETDTLVSLVFFFGAVCVVLVLKASQNSIKMLNITIGALHEKNSIYKRVKNELESSKIELEKSHIKLRESHEELEKTIDDFYALRLSLEDDEKKRLKKKIGAENKKIKKRINRLKRRNLP